MDQKKLKVLRDINFVIPKLCQICEHGTFPDAGIPFGTCTIRQIDTLTIGTCPKWEPDEDAIFDGLGDWAEFVDGRKYSRSNRHKAPTRY